MDKVAQKQVIRNYVDHWFASDLNLTVKPNLKSKTTEIAFIDVVCKTYDISFSEKITDCQLAGLASLAVSWRLNAVVLRGGVVRVAVTMKFHLVDAYRELAVREFEKNPGRSTLPYKIDTRDEMLVMKEEEYFLFVIKWLVFNAEQKKALIKVLKAIKWNYVIGKQMHPTDAKRSKKFEKLEATAIAILHPTEYAEPEPYPLRPLETLIECDFNAEAIAAHPLIGARGMKRLRFATDAFQFIRKIKPVTPVLSEYAVMMVALLNDQRDRILIILPDTHTYTPEVRDSLAHRSQTELHHFLLAHMVILGEGSRPLGSFLSLDETSLVISSESEDLLPDLVTHHNRVAKVVNHYTMANGNHVLVVDRQLYDYRIIHIAKAEATYTPIAYMQEQPQYSHFVVLLAAVGLDKELTATGDRCISVLAVTNDILTHSLYDSLLNSMDPAVLKLEVSRHLVEGIFNPEKQELESASLGGKYKITNGTVRTWANHPLVFAIDEPYTSIYFDRERLSADCRWIQTAGFLRGNLITVSNMLIGQPGAEEF